MSAGRLDFPADFFKEKLMMLKRIIAGALTLVMAVGAFAACGGKKEETKTDSPQTTTAATTNADLGIWADYKVDTTNNLSNPNATEKANVIYNWLCSIQGKYIISGLQEKCGDSDSEEFMFIKNTCEELPGLRALDFINGDYEGVTRRSQTWAKMGCLISICWHMGIPGEADKGYDSSKKSWPALEAALNDPSSEDYRQLIADIDKPVEYLKQLQDAGVVVLWRPFHEFDGKWFWWGMAGGESFVKLWQLMYDRYTNQYGLNNLIWVLGYSGNHAGDQSWYPGDDYVDIIGADTYNGSMASTGYSALYSALSNSFSGNGKPFALHECGKIPNAGALQSEGAQWLWFNVWHSNYIENEKENTISEIQVNFTSDYYLTLDEMPDFDALIANK